MDLLWQSRVFELSIGGVDRSSVELLCELEISLQVVVEYQGRVVEVARVVWNQLDQSEVRLIHQGAC